MITAMFLAHLVGDYILQWDSLAKWKSAKLSGVIAHSLIVTAVTWLFSLPFASNWWQGVLFISVTHFLIDAAPVLLRLQMPPLLRFIGDQILHILIIIIALSLGGYLQLPAVYSNLLQSMHDDRVLTYLLGYTFVTMPTWVFVKFLAYGLLRGTAPDFPEGTNKYIGILERVLITTFVALGQFLLVPIVTLPRLIVEWPRISGSDEASLYLVELLGGVTMAVVIGVAFTLL